jgi:CubicO group peptidase (beta-lactamase class C family)
MKGLRRATLIVIGLVAIASIAVASYYALRLVSIGAAYKAKTLCSGVFVANREPASVLNTDLAADDLSVLRHIDTKVDYTLKQVTADFFGIIKRKAMYRPGLGCSLTYDSDRELSSGKANTTQVAPTKMPEEEYDPRFDTALNWAFSEPDSTRLRRTRAVVVLRHGKIVAERYVPGFSRDTPLLGWSMTKGVINALVGIMVREKRLSLNGLLPVPEWREPNDPRRKITLDHLLHMTSGLRFNEDYGNPLGDVTYMLLGVPDMAAYASRNSLAVEPGAKWSYSSGTTNILSRIIRQVVGDANYIDLPRSALFQRIGMNSAIIEQDASGTFVGSSFMYATARDWAKFGQLYLQDGVWGGQRVLPEGWVEFTTTPAPQAPDKEYGAHFWLKIPKEYQGDEHDKLVPGDAFHAVGHEGQFISIIPSLDLVIVRLGLTRFPSAWQHDGFLHLVIDALEQ